MSCPLGRVRPRDARLPPVHFFARSVSRLVPRTLNPNRRVAVEKEQDPACIAIVAGTRPEIVKLAPVYRALRAQDRFAVQWIHTGQHGEMAREMLRCFGIVPDVELARTGDTLEDFSSGCRTQLDALRARAEPRVRPFGPGRRHLLAGDLVAPEAVAARARDIRAVACV